MSTESSPRHVPTFEEIEEASTDKPAISIYELLETDTDAEQNGRWFKNLFARAPQIELKLRRFTSRKSIEARMKLASKYKRFQKADGAFDEEIANLLICEQLADGVIVDWKGIFDRDGQPIEFSPVVARKLLSDLPEFRDVVVAMAYTMDNFRAVEREEIAGN